MFTLESLNRKFHFFYILSLVALWIGATIANIATLMDLKVELMSLAAISVGIAYVMMHAGKALPKAA